MDELVAAQLATVPELYEFLTVDELAARASLLAEKYPEAISVERVGTSRLGDPIFALRALGGEREALVFAAVHPNEPIGGLTALHLAEQLCDPRVRERLGYSWTIVPCIDPDGTRLNEGWFKGPFTRSHYGRNFYRPEPEQQVEWTFPFHYKDAWFDAVLPETLALMRLIDDRRPALMCSLHNGELGGAYFYLSRAVPELYDPLQEIPVHLGLPLELGEPEVPYVERLEGAVFKMIRSEDRYSFAEAAGTDPLARQGGASSASYAERYGTLTLIGELPYWVDPRAGDTSPAGEAYEAAVKRRAACLRGLAGTLGEALDAVRGDLVTRSPFLRATEIFAKSLAQTAAEDEHRAGLPESRREATVAERHGLEDLVHCFRVRYGGMALRALDGELAVGNGTPAIRRERARIGELYEDWAAVADAATPMPPAPIRALVGTQYGAILAAALTLSGTP
jgi:hypothetical protein